jgi:flagellar motor switch protein FliN/FliY
MPEDLSSGVKKAEFSSLTDDVKGDKPIDINFLMDITLLLSIELGRAVMNVKDILSLRDGSVVELNKLAGDPVDIFVNNKLIARGEVVVIDDNFGVRVTDILSPTELLNNLRNHS